MKSGAGRIGIRLKSLITFLFVCLNEPGQTAFPVPEA